MSDDNDDSDNVTKSPDDNEEPNNNSTWQEQIAKIEQKQEDILNYYAGFADDPESFPAFDLEEILNVKSYKYNEKGTWDPTVIWFGTRRTGKSVSLKYLLEAANDKGLIGRVTVITGTKQNHFWDHVVPSCCVFGVEDALGVIEDIKNKQNTRASMIRSGKKLKYGIEAFQHTLILDDVVHNKSLARYSDVLTEAFMTFRHTGCAVLITSQYPTAIAPSMRNNADFVFVQLLNGYDAKEVIFKDHLEFFPKRNLAFYFLDTVPREWRSIVIHKTDPELYEIDKVHWHRPVDLDNEFGLPNPINPSIKQIRSRWGSVNWRKAMDKTDKEYERIMKQQLQEGLEGSKGSNFMNHQMYDSSTSIYQRLGQIRESLCNF